MRCLFLWTVAVVVVLFHPAVGATCFLNNNRDVTRIYSLDHFNFWIIFLLLCERSINVAAVVVRTNNIGL